MNAQVASFFPSQSPVASESSNQFDFYWPFMVYRAEAAREREDNGSPHEGRLMTPCNPASVSALQHSSDLPVVTYTCCHRQVVTFVIELSNQTNKKEK